LYLEASGRNAVLGGQESGDRINKFTSMENFRRVDCELLGEREDITWAMGEINNFFDELRQSQTYQPY